MSCAPVPTAFEFKVLQSMIGRGRPGVGCRSSLIGTYGSKLWGAGWAGSPVIRQKVQTPTYPVIDGALGRLQRKGLVNRCPWSEMEAVGYTAGRWELTDLARDVLGLGPDE